jgi:hypothetical protein
MRTLLWKEGQHDLVSGPECGRLALRPTAALTPAEANLHVPASGADLEDQYDLTLSHPAVDMAEFAAFDRWLAHAATARGLTCALIHDGIVGEAIRRVETGRLRVGFHLDYFALWHVPDDPYARLVEAIRAAGGAPINPPESARHFTDKAKAHGLLRARGLGVPATVVVPSTATELPLPPAERAALGFDEPGTCVYIKPANGYGSRGIVRVEQPEPDKLTAALTSARSYDRQDAYLVQREVRTPRLRCDDQVERPAYWRILYCLGDLIPFWWQRDNKPSYRRLTEAEVLRHGVGPILAYVAAIANLSGLQWFSSEVCLSESREPSRYTVRGAGGRERPVVAIDYVNDQCDVDVQSRWPGAPPDDVVRYVAERFAEAAWEHKQGRGQAEQQAACQRAA